MENMTNQLGANGDYSEEYMMNLQQALDDKTFTNRLHGERDIGVIREAFATKGIILDDNIINTLITKLAYYDENGELDEETLEVVSGGKRMNMGTRFWGSVGWGLMAGAATGNPFVGVSVGIACFIVSHIA